MSQIIDIGNSGIQFADSGVIDLGSHGSGIQIIGPHGIVSKYLLKMSGIKDLVSKNSQTDTSAGAAYYIHPTTGELVTVAAGEPLIHPTLGNVSLPDYEQLCHWSEDPGEWDLISATRSATGETFGPFTEYAVADTGANWNNIKFWMATVSGQPAGILYFNLRYRAGTSGKIFLVANDATTGTNCIYAGTIGSAIVLSQNAGTLTKISDEYDSELGYYIFKGSIDFITTTNNLIMYIGPNSTTNQNIKVLGADVSEDPAILDFHVPSSGSNVTIASRAGTTKLAGLADNFPKFYDALNGIDGATAAAKISGVWTPGVDYGDVTTTGNKILSASLFAFLLFTTGGRFYSTADNTELALIDIDYSANTPYPFEIVYGPNTALAADKMQLNIQVDGVWQTIIAGFDGSFDPTDDLIYGLSNSYQSSIKNLVCEKLQQSHWRS